MTFRARFYAVVAVGIAVALGAFIVVAVTKLSSQGTDIGVLKRGAPCPTLQDALHAGADRKEIERLTGDCTSYLRRLSPLIPVRFACAVVIRAGYRCAARPQNLNARHRRGRSPPPRGAGGSTALIPLQPAPQLAPLPSSSPPPTSTPTPGHHPPSTGGKGGTGGAGGQGGTGTGGGGSGGQGGGLPALPTLPAICAMTPNLSICTQKRTSGRAL